MLKMPQQHTDDEKANAIISSYLNQNILDMVQDEITEFEEIERREASEDDPVFWDAVSSFFPEGYPEEKMGRVFLGLRALLESEYEFIPELVMEYVMYRLITYRIEISDDLDLSTLEPIPGERDYVIRVLKEEYPETTAEETDDDDMGFISWQEKLEQLEDLHYYEEVYFWDMDYLQLDFFTEEELANSPVATYLGIDNIENRSHKFILPPEWMK